MRIRVVFGGSERRLDVEEGEPLALALRGAGIPLRMECGGTGACRTCSVRIGGASILYQGAVLRIPEGDTWSVCSCQTAVAEEGGTVEVPATSLSE